MDKDRIQRIVSALDRINALHAELKHRAGLRSTLTVNNRTGVVAAPTENEKMKFRSYEERMRREKELKAERNALVIKGPPPSGQNNPPPAPPPRPAQPSGSPAQAMQRLPKEPCTVISMAAWKAKKNAALLAQFD